MKINKRTILASINLILGALTLWYFIYCLIEQGLGLCKITDYLYVFSFAVVAFLAILSGVMILLKKSLIWSLVGVVGLVICWIWHFILLANIVIV